MSTDTNVERLRQDKYAILDALRQAGAEVANPKAIRCPFHEDRTPSAGIWAGDDGAWRFKCQTPTCGVSGDVFDIRARISGKTVADELRAEHDPSRPPKQNRQEQAPPPDRGPDEERFAAVSLDALKANDSRITDTYCYPDRQDATMIVVRMVSDGRKQFRQLHPVAEGLAWGAPPKPWPILNGRNLSNAEEIIICEGEKDCRTLYALGFIATTSPGGAGKSHHADWTPCSGTAKRVYIWPDADEPNTKGERTGIAHGRQVVKILQSLPDPPRVFWIDPDKLGLSGGADVTDYLADQVDLDDASKAALIREIIDEAEPLGPSVELSALLEDAIAGRRKAIPFPWPELSNVSKALAPSAVTLLVAPPAASKSFMVLQCVAYWQANGFKPAVLMLEEKRDYHLRRALAQRCGVAHVTDDDWCAQNPEMVREMYQHEAEFLDAIGCCIHTPPTHDAMTYDDVADWVEGQASAGRDLLVIDPLSIVSISRDQYVHDQKFIGAVKRTCEMYGCRVVIVMHPRKLAQTMTLDDVAGGAAFTRLAQCVLWLQFHKKPQSVTVYDPHMRVRVQDSITRTVHILKARNAVGTGRDIGFRFERESLTFHECGLILESE